VQPAESNFLPNPDYPYIYPVTNPINLNGQALDNLPELLEQAQRALYYGDALFETLRVFDRHLPFLNRHWDRLASGMRLIGFEFPDYWDAVFFDTQIRRISPPNARVRLTVWRSPGGRYAPMNNVPQFLITAEGLPAAILEWPEFGLELGVCESVCLPVDEFSNLKTLNAPRYTAAAREAKVKDWDDALVLNSYNRICESTSSNVFWWEGDRLCTVPLSEGCVAGVFRSFLIETTRDLGIPVMEKVATPETLLAAGEIFLTNAVRGIVPVRIFAGQSRPSILTRQLFGQVNNVLFRKRPPANSQQP